SSAISASSRSPSHTPSCCAAWSTYRRWRHRSSSSWSPCSTRSGPWSSMASARALGRSPAGRSFSWPRRSRPGSMRGLSVRLQLVDHHLDLLVRLVHQRNAAGAAVAAATVASGELAHVRPAGPVEDAVAAQLGAEDLVLALQHLDAAPHAGIPEHLVDGHLRPEQVDQMEEVLLERAEAGAAVDGEAELDVALGIDHVLRREIGRVEAVGLADQLGELRQGGLSTI